MKVAITGTHGAYKTSIVNSLFDALHGVGKKAKIVNEVHRITSESIAPGVKIFMQKCEHTVSTSTLQRAMEHYLVAESIKAGEKLNLISDRTPLDTFLYFDGDIMSQSDEFISCYKAAVNYTRDNYDRIYIVNADQGLGIEGDDSFRDDNKKEQMRINEIFIKKFTEEFPRTINVVNQVDIHGKEKFDNFIARLINLF